MREQVFFIVIACILLLSIIGGGLWKLNKSGMTFVQIQIWHLVAMLLALSLLVMSFGCTPY
jgi:hypothetical protein